MDKDWSRLDTGQDIYRTRCLLDRMIQERMDVGQDKSGEEGCRTGQMQDWADALQDGWKTR